MQLDILKQLALVQRNPYPHSKNIYLMEVSVEMYSMKNRAPVPRALIALVLVATLAVVPYAGALAAQDTTDAGRNALLGLQNAFTSIAEQVEPAMVYIEAERTSQVRSADPFEDFFRGWPFGIPNRNSQPRTRTQTSRGSGVIVRADGYILTNDHVVGGADKVTVYLSGNRKLEGTVLRDPQADLALIKVEAEDLPVAVLGNSDTVKPGQWAIAIGNPGGQFTNTLTVGVVSAVTRDFRVPDPEMPNGVRLYQEAIQTDAAINFGNSGGPLLNIDGEIIGINAAIWSPSGSGGSVGIGFAIPANRAKWVMDQLISTGKVVRGRLGVSIDELDSDRAAHYGATAGALVQSVEDGSPAQKAGIEVEDVIVEFGGQKVTSSSSLIRLVERTAPETKATIVVLRDKKRIALDVTVGEMAGETAAEPASTRNNTGLTVTELTPEISKQLRLDPSIKGVAVQSVDQDSPAERAGIEAGDVILRINGINIASVADYNRMIGMLRSGDRAMVVLYKVIQGRGQTRIVTLRMA